MVAVGKKSSVLSTTEKFYEKLRDSRVSPKQMVNSPILIADNVGDVLGEAVRITSRSNEILSFGFFQPDVLAKSMQFFLQGIGLGKLFHPSTTEKKEFSSL